ncbi:unnamed protein product [Cyprideis torosa]|uniref:Uncharacterized protein n=1 Tax=Cyprideis torosa TaxID=163714 RepID=A0A7R8W296_9CRUS|nr:unnamed protein product [Cyprideis torosa]CAG0880746.1 unnamed protein product [Cyprideis torosa]
MEWQFEESPMRCAGFRSSFVRNVFLRAGVLSRLEALRDDRIQGDLVRLQALCRGCLARRKFAKLKVQDVAIRCIQKNIRKFMQVRHWSWWRLLVRVSPLLNVHRMEEELRKKTDDLESLTARLDRLEKERTRLKQENERLENKIAFAIGMTGGIARVIKKYLKAIFMFFSAKARDYTTYPL